ncbi:MAG: hypothetical protein LAO31_20385 [Acidobacteriia bacterium]|nr:hypothetical protein [Terriglobia bacterium]
MSILWSVIERLLDRVAPELLIFRRLRFTVHKAAFLESGREAFFLNATNLSKDREIELTHVWLASSPPIAAMQPERALPKRLKPDETWETWIYADAVPSHLHQSVVSLARARLSTGKQVRAKPNRDVPPIGAVPGH